jgi:hypothetical protein|tara:strand:- start:314 stop:529 length:216 start_codon:yes stop_codon:yes gene_type:complete
MDLSPLQNARQILDDASDKEANPSNLIILYRLRNQLEREIWIHLNMGSAPIPYPETIRGYNEWKGEDDESS